MKLSAPISLGSITGLFKRQAALMFWLCLGIVVILDLFVIQRSGRIILHVRKDAAQESMNQHLVRINFTSYNEALDKIEANENYVPAGVPNIAPFGFAPGKAPQQ